MDLHYKREVTVGALVIVGLVIFVAGTMWLRGKTFHPAWSWARSRTSTSRRRARCW
jgi:hypothetical protein